MRRATLLALVSHWRRHPVQAVTLALGLALATALWSGVQAINTEARKSYAAAANTLGQTSYDRLTGPEVRVSDFTALRRAGWNVSPVIEGRIGPDLLVIGIDPLSSPPRPGLSSFADGTFDLATFLTAPGLLLIAPETDVSGLSGLPPVQLAADLPMGTALTDIRTAQHLLDQDALSYLILHPDQANGLPPLQDLTSLSRVTPEDGTDIAQLTDSFHLNLTAFGLLSFAVGLFIVQSAIGLAFEQRRPTFRTLRAMGVPLGLLVRLLAAELALFALIAGALGLVLGYAIAAALLPGVAGTLRGLYGADVAGSLTFDPVWALSALAITFAGTALAGAQALWTVARLPLLASARPRAWARASAVQIRIQLGAACALLAVATVAAVY
ncbi:MAG: FtsX-like permease family protein, partial [Rhodobacteraceae bacterium]|nr:FtsX-like permease family protein [Paracoccaceae bacterium]